MAISPDLLHDQWFFQHFMDKKVLPWIKSNAAEGVVFSHAYGFSDGAPTQFFTPTMFFGFQLSLSATALN